MMTVLGLASLAGLFQYGVTPNKEWAVTESIMEEIPKPSEVVFWMKCLDFLDNGVLGMMSPSTAHGLTWVLILSFLFVLVCMKIRKGVLEYQDRLILSDFFMRKGAVILEWLTHCVMVSRIGGRYIMCMYMYSALQANNWKTILLYVVVLEVYDLTQLVLRPQSPNLLQLVTSWVMRMTYNS